MRGDLWELCAVGSTVVLAGSRYRARSVMRLCDVCFVVVVMVLLPCMTDLILLPLFACGAYPITFFFIAAWVLFKRVNGQGKTDIRGRYCVRLCDAANSRPGKDLVLLRMGQSIRQCR